MTPGEQEEIAAALAQAERDRAQIPPLIESHPGIGVDDAYAIQLINIERRIRAGASVRGLKIGFTSAATQKMFGLTEPDFGHLLDDMFVAENSAVAVSALCQPMAEPEIAFVLGAGLMGPAVTVADVLRATDFIVPAIEIADSRIADWKITLPDTVADNGAAALVVLGATPTPLEALDIRLIGVAFSVNGEIVETGASAAALGNPANAVAWLANEMAGYGLGLDAGHVVMTGSNTRAVAVKAGDSVRADFGGLGGVGVRFA